MGQLISKVKAGEADPIDRGDPKKGKSDAGFSLSSLVLLDRFPYLPSYKYHAYRSSFGAVCSIFFVFIFVLRIVDTTSSFFTDPPTITQTRQAFSRDVETAYNTPRIGVLFKKDGWKPFNDITYFRLQFHQGLITQSGNITYEDLGGQLCNFIDEDGRLIAEDARCPIKQPQVQGDYYDKTFRFVRARIVRCNNGTDVEGKPIPGPCQRPEVIDDLIWAGTVNYYIEQVNLKSDSLSEQVKIVSFRREFMAGVHVAVDMFFTVLNVVTRPRLIFENIPTVNLVLFDSKEEAYTNFDPEKAQYAAVYYRLGGDEIKQRRESGALFDLFESWGAMGAFLYIFFGLTATWWNSYYFNKQVKGLDLRKMDKEQFTEFGKLIDKSFQMPREYQDMQAD